MCVVCSVRLQLSAPASDHPMIRLMIRLTTADTDRAASAAARRHWDADGQRGRLDPIHVRCHCRVSGAGRLRRSATRAPRRRGERAPTSQAAGTDPRHVDCCTVCDWWQQRRGGRVDCAAGGGRGVLALVEEAMSTQTHAHVQRIFHTNQRSLSRCHTL